MREENKYIEKFMKMLKLYKEQIKKQSYKNKGIKIY